LTKQRGANNARKHLSARASSVSGNAACAIQKITMKSGFFASSIARADYTKDA